MWRPPKWLGGLADIIRANHVALAAELYGVDSLTEADKRLLVYAIDEGIVSGVDVSDASLAELRWAWKFGAWLARDPDVAVSAGRLEDAPELSDWEQRMAHAARMHGAQLVVGLGNKTAQGAVTGALAVDMEQAKKHAAAIAEEVASSIEAGKTWKQAQGAIGDALGDDWARDLGRIAATETQRAVNEGYAAALEWDNGREALVAVIPQPTACKSCIGFYIDPATGAPRIFKLSQLPPSSVNFKKKAADKVACIPPAHPWCHCQLVHVEAGWAFDAEWNLLPPGVSMGGGGQIGGGGIESPPPTDTEATP